MIDEKQAYQAIQRAFDLVDAVKDAPRYVLVPIKLPTNTSRKRHRHWIRALRNVDGPNSSLLHD